MILTVTLNPCLDKCLFVERNVAIETLRPQQVVDLAGGKGVNVARALAGLGEPAAALMPLGGAPGTQTEELARLEGLDPIIVSISGRTRTALTIREESSGLYWHYLEPGPEWQSEEIAALRRAYAEALGRCDLVVISGSLPSAVAEPLFGWMIKTGRECGVPVLLDSHGLGLQLGLAARPWLVKPNREELAGVLGHPLHSDEAAWLAVREVAASGIPVVVLSAGAAPLLASWDGQEWEVVPPRVPTINALGSGDSLVAGIAAAVRWGWPALEALRWGVACGAANAAVWDPGGISLEQVERLVPHVLVHRPGEGGEDGHESPGGILV